MKNLERANKSNVALMFQREGALFNPVHKHIKSIILELANFFHYLFSKLKTKQKKKEAFRNK